MTWTDADVKAVTDAARRGRTMREAVQAGRVPDAVAVAAITRPAGQAQRFEALPRPEDDLKQCRTD